MFRRVLATAIIVLVLCAATGAHEKYRMVGIVTKLQPKELQMKSKEGAYFTVYLVAKTVYQKERKQTVKSALKVGQTVVVDAWGDGDEDLEALVINIVPAIPAAPPSGGKKN